MNAGRSCWVVAGTLRGGTIQGTYAKKTGTCRECEFYKRVRTEVGHKFVYSSVLLAKIDTAATGGGELRAQGPATN